MHPTFCLYNTLIAEEGLESAKAIKFSNILDRVQTFILHIVK